MPFKPPPTSGPFGRGADRRRSGDTVDVRDPVAPPLGEEDEASKSFFAAERGAALRKERDAENLAGFGPLSARHSPFPLIFSLAAAFLVILAICWSLWER